MAEKKRLLTDCLHLFVLTQFALAQPLLYRLSSRTVYLDDQGIERTTVFLMVAVLCLVVPAVLCLIEVLALCASGQARGSESSNAAHSDHTSPTRERGLLRGFARKNLAGQIHQVIAFILVVAILLPVLKRVEFLSGMVVVTLSLVLAALAVSAYRRYSPAQWFVTAASPALLVFPAQFLFFSPVSRHLFPRPDPPPVPVTIEHPVPVVLLVFDEFCGTSLMNRQGEIDRPRYPNFAALAETATWYRNASTVHPRTELAIPAILTGTYPRRRRPATVAEYPTNLFTLLESTGQYEFVVFEPYTRLCRAKPDEKRYEPKSVREQWSALAGTLPLVYLEYLFPTDLPFELPFVPAEWDAVKRAPPDRPDSRTGVFRYPWNASRAEQFGEFLGRIEPPGQPTLYFCHLAVPHSPWCFLPSGRKYMLDDGQQPPAPGTSDTNLETWAHDELAVLHGHERYLLQVGYADHLLGKLVDRLRTADLFDRCLLIVMADHGVSFRPGLSRRLPVDESVPDLASIPFFIKLPEQRQGKTSDRNVESIDVLPTIVEVLGLGKSVQTDGDSLLDTSRPERPQKLFFDDTRTVTLNPAFESKQATWSRMLEYFGDGSEPERFFRIGPHHALLGRSTQEFCLTDRAGPEILITEPARSYATEPEAIMPCYFSGRVKAHDASQLPIELAIAVNDTIYAVTRSYSEKKISYTWSAIVPETAFQGGPNEVQVFVVTTVDEQITLGSVAGSPIRLNVAK